MVRPGYPSVEREAERSLQRLLPRLEARLARISPELWSVFRERLRTRFLQLFAPLLHIYGDRYDFFYHLESVLELGARSWMERPPELRELDASREANPDWFQSERMLGAMCYVDRFAGDLTGLRKRIPYLRQLGVTYLHLMPLFRCPEVNNDSGYAVSRYREVNPRLGTMDELTTLLRELRLVGISPVLDFV